MGIIVVALVLALASPSAAPHGSTTVGVSKHTINRIRAFVDGMIERPRRFTQLSEREQLLTLELPDAVMDWAKRYPSDELVPVYLYRAGLVVHTTTPQLRGARTLFYFLIANYPRSQYAAQARAELDRLTVR